MLTDIAIAKLKFSSTPDKPKLRCWQDYKEDIIATVRRIDALYGGFDEEWLHTYCKEIIIKHRENLEVLKVCVDKLEEGMLSLSLVAPHPCSLIVPKRESRENKVVKNLNINVMSIGMPFC